MTSLTFGFAIFSLPLCKAHQQQLKLALVVDALFALHAPVELLAHEKAPAAPLARRLARRLHQKPRGVVRAHPPQLHKPKLILAVVERDARGIDAPQLLADDREDDERLLLLFEKLTQKLERYTDEEQSEKEQDSDWSAFLSRYIRTVALYGVIMAGIGIIGRYWLLPLLETALPSASAAKAVTLAVIYLGMALFIRPMLDTRSPQYTVLWMKKRSFRLPLMALSGIRILLIALIAFIPLRNIAGIGSAWLLPVIVAALLLASRMGWLASAYLNVEARFLTNLNERQLQHFSDSGEYEQWLDEKLCVDSFSLPASFTGQSLKDLGWGRRFGVNVIKLVHGKRRKNMPAGNTALAAGDTIYVVGERENLRTLRLSLGLDESADAPTLREYIGSESKAEGGLYSYALHVDKGDSLDGRSIKDSGIRENYDCMILGLQRGNLPIVQPDVNMTIQDNDIVWLLGTRVMAGKVLRDADV